MKDWKRIVAALLLMACLCPTLSAQQSGAAASAASAAGLPTTVPPASGIVGLVQMVAAKLKACKAKLCACPLGQMITNLGKTINLFAGGLLCPPCCPPIPEADKNKSPTSAQGACARIMQEEMEMPARRKAVQCLAHFDCHWWPEAEAALINALRTDTNECVRQEAALVLSTGCCCTKKTIEALAIVVSGSKKDGNPSENSERVRAAALGALMHCLASYQEVIEDLKPPEKPPAARPPVNPAITGLNVEPNRLAYYDTLDSRSEKQVAEYARKVMVAASKPQPAAVAVSTAADVTQTGHRNLFDIWQTSQRPGTTPRAPGEPASAPTAPTSRTQPTAPPAPRVRLTFRE